MIRWPKVSMVERFRRPKVPMTSLSLSLYPYPYPIQIHSVSSDKTSYSVKIKLENQLKILRLLQLKLLKTLTRVWKSLVVRQTSRRKRIHQKYSPDWRKLCVYSLILQQNTHVLVFFPLSTQFFLHRPATSDYEQRRNPSNYRHRGSPYHIDYKDTCYWWWFINRIQNSSTLLLQPP